MYSFKEDISEPNGLLSSKLKPDNFCKNRPCSSTAEILDLVELRINLLR
jgi:hypothetical protein